MALIRVDAPHMLAGAIAGDGNIISRAAPVLTWAIGKTVDELSGWCRRNGYGCERLSMARRKDVKPDNGRLIYGETAVDKAGRPRRSWDRSHGTYIAGRAHVDEADLTAAQMDGKWGVDRLRLLVGPELREKFDRQRYLFNQAIWHGDLEAVRREAGRMVKAWLALDRAAEAAEREPVHSDVVWEIGLADGTVAAIVRDGTAAKILAAWAEGRSLRVYTLDEIGRLLSTFPDIARIKETFPGATVTVARRTVDDPLDAIADTENKLDDEIGDLA